MDSDRGRLLFVLDNDFGELTLAMCFLHRQAFAARSTLLLPPRLYALNSRSLGVRAIPYASYDELIGSLEAERADLVFLCSGYLLGLHGLIPRGSLGDLVSRVRRSGARVVTFDPFWGLMATPHELVREHFLQASRSGPLGRMLSMITRWSRPLRFMTEASGVLRSIPHLYPAPIVTSKVAAMSFFNRALVTADPGDLTTAEPGLGDEPRPHWLFILNGEDHRRQIALHGSGRWAGRMAETMRETRSQGRHPVLLAPEACLEGVRSRMGSSGGASLLAYCSYPRFVSLLMRAENVFYWNVITASSLLRLVNHRPVFYFDLGHIRAGLEPVYRQAVRWFFRGWQPPRLDPGGSLGADRLAHGWRESAGPVETMCANFRTAPTPAQVVDGFLSEVSPTPGVLHAHS